MMIKIASRRLCLAGAAALLMGTPLAAGDLPQTVAEADAAFSLATQWVSGALDDYNAPEITYDGDPIKLRMSMHTPAVAGLSKFNESALKILERMSGGKITPEFRPGGVVHSVSEGFDANRNGLTDMSPCFVFYNPTNFPMTQALSLPGLFPDAAVMQRVIEDIYPKYLKEEFERQGVYALGMVGSARFRIFSNMPITTLEEMQGKKVRSGGGINQRIFQALGAATVNMSSQDMQQSLQRGLIDAIYTSDAAGMIFKLEDVARHHTDVAINHTELDWCMNRRWYDALPQDLKVVVNDWGRAMFQAQTQLPFMRAAVIGRTKSKKAGMVFHTLTPEEQARWDAAYASVTEEYLSDMDKRGLPAREMVAEIKALSARYAPMSYNDLMRDAIDNPNRSFLPGLN